MQRTVLACQTVEAEIRAILPPDVPMKALEQGLHRTPEQLRETLQREIDSSEADEILLGYGLCGNGLAGLCSARARLVVPRVDDCIAILLGSYERYVREFHREPGTYWFSFGWIEYGRDPFTEYQRCLEKWDEETARWVAHETMKGYHRVALLDTGVCPLPRLQAYARRFADFFGLEYTEMPGSDFLLRALLSGDRSDGQMVVVEPGQRITMDMFGVALGVTNP